LPPGQYTAEVWAGGDATISIIVDAPFAGGELTSLRGFVPGEMHPITTFEFPVAARCPLIRIRVVHHGSTGGLIVGRVSFNRVGNVLTQTQDPDNVVCP
jgi:hypothetical protein